jgi:hypothetical protein
VALVYCHDLAAGRPSATLSCTLRVGVNAQGTKKMIATFSLNQTPSLYKVARLTTGRGFEPHYFDHVTA